MIGGSGGGDDACLTTFLLLLTAMLYATGPLASLPLSGGVSSSMSEMRDWETSTDEMITGYILNVDPIEGGSIYEQLVIAS